MFKTPRSHTLIAILAATGLAGAATPALAKDKPEDSIRMTIKKHNGKTYYCAKDAPRLGSNIVQKTCQSREDWAKEGINIPESGRAADNRKASTPG